VPREAIRNMEMPVFKDYNRVIRGARMGAVTVCGNPPLRVSLDSRCPRERNLPESKITYGVIA